MTDLDALCAMLVVLVRSISHNEQARGPLGATCPKAVCQQHTDVGGVGIRILNMISWMVGHFGLLLNIMLTVSSQLLPKMLRRPRNLQRPFPNNSVAVSNGPSVLVATCVSSRCC